MATIGSLTADLSLKAATFIRDLDRATDSVRRSSRDMERHASQIQRGFDRAGAAVKSFGVGLASAIGVGSVAGVARLSKDTLDAAGNLGEMATAAGLATRELQALQFAGVQVGVSQEELVRSMGQFANRVGEALRGMIPLSVRQSITRCLPRSIRYQLNTKWMNADIDWARTRAFCIPNSNEGYFRINLEGREPRGNVAPGDSYRQLVRSLRTELDGLVNPASGRRCAHGVHAIDETFEGPERQHLPDVVISWDFDAEVLDQVQGPSSGLISGRRSYETPAYYTGNHRPHAFVLGYGPDVTAGDRAGSGHIVDIAPTILAICWQSIRLLIWRAARCRN